MEARFRRLWDVESEGGDGLDEVKRNSWRRPRTQERKVGAVTLNGEWPVRGVTMVEVLLGGNGRQNRVEWSSGISKMSYRWKIEDGVAKDLPDNMFRTICPRTIRLTERVSATSADLVV